MNFNDLSPEDCLQIYGLRNFGRLTDPTKLSTGGRTGIDPEALLVIYVESTDGFAKASEALRWVYVNGRAPEDFPLRRPGESYGTALIRRGWGMYLGFASSRVCEAVINEFKGRLADRMKRSPCVIPPQPKDLDDAESIVQDVQDSVDNHSPTW